MPWLPILRRCTRRALLAFICVLTGLVTMGVPGDTEAQAVDPAIARSMAKTQKPPLHGRKWMAITGKPLAATAGAMMFERGGNAVDAACAMIAATATMWDVLSWGGETQALIYDPRSRKVIAISGLVAPPGLRLSSTAAKDSVSARAGARCRRSRRAPRAGSC
jgi:gamma-glutamyltranspeptidase